MPMLWDGLKVLCAIALVYAVAVMFFLQESTLSSQFERERIAQHGLLGDQVAGYAETRASNTFTVLAVNSGVMQQTFNSASLSIPSLPSASKPDPTPTVSSTALDPTTSATSAAQDASSSSASGTSGIASPVAPSSSDVASTGLPSGLDASVNNWAEQRVRVCWSVLFFTLVRLSYALIWWPFAVLSMGPALVDAIAARKVQATTFALTSPQLQGAVMRILPLSFAAYFLLIFLPFYEPPLTVPIGIFVTSAMVWLGIVEFAKRG